MSVALLHPWLHPAFSRLTGDANLFAAQLKWFGAQDEGMRVLTLQEALEALLGKGIETIILDIKDGPPFGADGFASMSLDAIEAARCKECIVWAKEDVVVAEVISRGLGAKAGFVLMNETAEARDRGMHRMGRIQARWLLLRHGSLLQHAVLRTHCALPSQGASILAVHWGMVDEQLVAAARGHKLRVFGWTANTVSMIDPLIRAGVAAIVTDQVRFKIRAVDVHVLTVHRRAFAAHARAAALASAPCSVQAMRRFIVHTDAPRRHTC